MRSATTGMQFLLNLHAMLVLMTQGEHLRADLQAESSSAVGVDSISSKMKGRGGLCAMALVYISS